ncbi:hypothetical protein [Spiroplasma endosymbiont of Danaus chrysippus]|uniref:hypothetical protein n=1 Tax=Spiroplasma endosymbiont of Danaus chrysippus TaxID=2691041 RepID=UPI00157B73CA|nr:hypothetical protein [Spiroplasma endosymbiont of Danaus chrysippus]
MAYVYLIKYKAFCTFVEASNFHKNYKHRLLENAFITHYEILVLEVDMNCTNPEKH